MSSAKLRNTVADKEFLGAGQAPGIEIWRIEKLAPVKVPKAQYGKFYEGDSYIILHTQKRENALVWDIYFWLGKDTSQDEMGVAAYKTVELDDSLGGAPVQHREVQEHESKEMLSVFKGGIEYLAGGIESGFKHVEKDKYETRLLHLKGKRNVRVRQVELSYKSLNQGDVFILDAGLKLYQWNGTEASRQEKAKGVEVIRRIRDNERGARAEIIVLEGANANEPKEFWDALGGKGAIATADKGGDDEGYERTAIANTKLYCISSASGGTLTTDEIKASPLTQNLLDTSHCFILDCGADIFVWVGTKSSKEEKKESTIIAQSFLTKFNYPKFTPITRVLEGGETPLFKEKFQNWVSKEKPTVASGPKIAKVEQKAIDVKGLHAKKAGPQDEPMIDDGTGTLETFRIEDLKTVAVPPELNGILYGGDSYILKYTYKKNGKECFIFYFWQGNKSSQDEKAASALLTVKMDDELGGGFPQVRVVQGKEPNHFIALFKGKLLIRSGGKASGFKNRADVDSYNNSGTALFGIRGTNPLNIRGVEVNAKAASLNSNDSFVLATPTTVYCWFGKGSNQAERNNAKNIAGLVKAKKAVKEIDEGTEPADFWSALGGKGTYASSPALIGDAHEPRLFQCSNASGAFRVDEVFNFNQDDLDDDDVFILDTFDEIYVWVGSGANETEKKMALESAIGYVETATDGRSKDTPILRITSGSEPPLFTAFFQGWDSSRSDAYERKLKEIGVSAPVDARASLAAYSQKYSFEDLKKRPLPSTVDAGVLENYLQDSDFQKAFKMDKAAFLALPAWKKNDQKKKAGLF